ncbi:metallophosphoesterase family protein [Paracoccus beibuensis]|uniref:metallophosphoesterase family protein n=1 Tax=Paracoccus beibuensis TaxID=547602 RepID=UPI0022406100|nr:metallophosphoesterase [Paracoccus beibuensis]
MARILHLSDLHFGFHRRGLVAPLLARIGDARPDLVVVTGDMTHRALPGQMAEARAFLDRIEAPLLLVPGNHDIPTFNPVARLFWPFAGYRKRFGRRLAPAGQAGDVRVLGINSADPYRWQRGKFRKGEIRRLVKGLDRDGFNIIALHHPLEQLPQMDKQPARRADEAMARLQAAGVRIALSGHLHRYNVDALIETGKWPGVLQLQAGTALCARITDGQNEYAVLEIDGDDLRLERHVAPMTLEGFLDPEIAYYRRISGRWGRV